MTSAWQRIAALELVVEGYELERLAVELSPEFTRVTTVVHLHGAGHKGAGEDVTYSTQEHDAFQAAGPVLPLAGRWTIATFNEHLGSLDLFPSAPDSPVYRRYRRWGIESAALDLALRQADESLHSVLDRAPAPVRFVASLRLPEPPTLDPVRARLAQHADLRFKLDPTPSWDEALVEELAALDAVAVCDLKGYYTGTVVDNPPDPALYRRVVEAFPDAWIEDPALTPETEPILASHRNRITWDAPIHTVADVRGLAFAPRVLNVKPSRLGDLRELFAFYDYCEEHQIGLYGGGQSELGVGRGQVQYLASLFHADAPNDVAPSAYNLSPPQPGLPGSPLAPRPSPTGFRWQLK
jgi:L-alanine-DL-glutamate epimerase-like enolase superfamily enzyme